MEKKYIYGIYDPANGHIRYVGQTNNPKARLQQHCASKRGANKQVAKWVKKLRKEGRKPEMVILDIAPAKQSRALERRIEKACWGDGIRSGYRLLNGGRAPVEPQEPEPGAFVVWEYRIKCECGALYEYPDDGSYPNEIILVDNPVNSERQLHLCPVCGRANSFKRVWVQIPWDTWWVSQNGCQES